MMNFKEFDFSCLVPFYMQPDYKLYSLLANQIFKRVIEKVSHVETYGNVESLPEIILDNLSWELNVDFYSADLSIEAKRGLIQNAILFQMQKGTPKALEDMLEVIFDTSEVVEWFDYSGDPGKFKIKTDDYVDEEKYKSIEEIINVVKRNSSHLESFILNRVNTNTPIIGTYIHTARKTVIEVE